MNMKLFTLYIFLILILIECKTINGKIKIKSPKNINYTMSFEFEINRNIYEILNHNIEIVESCENNGITYTFHTLNDSSILFINKGDYLILFEKIKYLKDTQLVSNYLKRFDFDLKKNISNEIHTISIIGSDSNKLHWALYTLNQINVGYYNTTDESKNFFNIILNNLKIQINKKQYNFNNFFKLKDESL